MIYNIFIVIFSISTINTAPISYNKTPDSQISVILPISIVAIIIVVIIFICYFYLKKNGYQRIQDDSSKSYSQQSSDDIKDHPVGLLNTAEDCYMNSVIQAMAGSEKFIIQLSEYEWNKQIKSNTLKVLLKLIYGVNNVTEKSTVESNTKLLKFLINCIKWEKTLQQDTFDFFSAIINDIHNNFKNIIPLFKFQMVHYSTGFNMKPKLQYHIGLSIGLYGPYTEEPGVEINYLIEQNLAPSNIDNDSSKTSQMSFFEKPPDILVCHVQANKWDEKNQKMYKPVYFIQYSKKLSFNMTIITNINNIENPDNEYVEYNLVAVISHIGDYGSGHYMTYRNYKGNWFLCNDKRIQKTTFDNTICPYLMIYELIN